MIGRSCGSSGRPGGGSNASGAAVRPGGGCHLPHPGYPPSPRTRLPSGRLPQAAPSPARRPPARAGGRARRASDAPHVSASACFSVRLTPFLRPGHNLAGIGGVGRVKDRRLFAPTA